MSSGRIEPNPLQRFSGHFFSNLLLFGPLDGYIYEHACSYTKLIVLFIMRRNMFKLSPVFMALIVSIGAMLVIGIQKARATDTGTSLSGYEIVWGPVIYVPNDGINHTTTMTCPSRKKLLSIQCNSAYNRSYLNGSWISKDYPNYGGCSWRNEHSSTDRAYAIGVCAYAD